MAHLLTLHYNDWTMDEQGNQVPAANCTICAPLDGRMYPGGSQPGAIPHAPGYYGDDEIVYHCGCYYVDGPLVVEASDPNHTHPDLVQEIHDLNITEFQKQILDLGAAVQALVTLCNQSP